MSESLKRELEQKQKELDMYKKYDLKSELNKLKDSLGETIEQSQKSFRYVDNRTTNLQSNTGGPNINSQELMNSIRLQFENFKRDIFEKLQDTSFVQPNQYQSIFEQDQSNVNLNNTSNNVNVINNRRRVNNNIENQMNEISNNTIIPHIALDDNNNVEG